MKKQLKFLVFDTETTGLTLPSVSDLSKQPKIIEFGALITDGKEILKTYNQLINPGEQITAEIMKITGITNDDLKDKPRFGEVYSEIKDLFDGIDVLLAHNAPFDTSLLKFELARLGAEDFIWPERIICTVEEYVPEFGFRPNLRKLYERKLGIELKQTHRAIDDVLALCECLFKDSYFEYLIGE